MPGAIESHLSLYNVHTSELMDENRNVGNMPYGPRRLRFKGQTWRRDYLLLLVRPTLLTLSKK